MQILSTTVRRRSVGPSGRGRAEKKKSPLSTETPPFCYKEKLKRPSCSTEEPSKAFYSAKSTINTYFYHQKSFFYFQPKKLSFSTKKSLLQKQSYYLE